MTCSPTGSSSCSARAARRTRSTATRRCTAATSSPTLGTKQVTKVTTKMLTDLYGAHQSRGLAPRSVYQIHACLSSMFTQACRWGWRDTNPAQWAEPPSIPNVAPVVPTPEEVRALDRCGRAVAGAPSTARAIFVAATTGLRRAELCALCAVARRRLGARACSTCRRRVVGAAGRADRGDPDEEPPGAHDRARRADDGDPAGAGRDGASSEPVRSCRARRRRRIVFTDAADGSEPWKPDAVVAVLRSTAQAGRPRPPRLPLPAQVHGDLRPGAGLLRVAGGDARRPRPVDRRQALQRPRRARPTAPWRPPSHRCSVDGEHDP